MQSHPRVMGVPELNCLYHRVRFTLVCGVRSSEGSSSVSESLTVCKSEVCLTSQDNPGAVSSVSLFLKLSSAFWGAVLGDVCCGVRDLFQAVLITLNLPLHLHLPSCPFDCSFLLSYFLYLHYTFFSLLIGHSYDS